MFSLSRKALRATGHEGTKGINDRQPFEYKKRTHYNFPASVLPYNRFSFHCGNQFFSFITAVANNEADEHITFLRG